MPAAVRRRLVVVLLLVAGALALAAAASGGNGGVAPPEPNSPNAGSINDAYLLILTVTGIVFLLVEGALIFFIAKYRRGGRPREEEGPQVHGDRTIEIVWTVVPVLLLVGIVSFVFYKLPGIEDTPPATAGDHLNVRVEGHQFYWLFKYPDGRSAINVLEVPVDRVVTLDITASDVVHSWWVPQFGGKIDAIPGKVNHTWFKPERTGTFPLKCAEFCGFEHAGMRGAVRVLPPGAEPGRLSQLALGKEAVDNVCASCHGDGLQGGFGPKIAGSALFADEKGMRDIIRNGIRTMPAVGRTWPDELVDATIAYLKTQAGSTQGATTSGG
jgi:cytochrome c oxidase subunit II